MSDDLDLTELYADFRDEAGAQLDELDAALRALEAPAGLAAPARAGLLRALHTLKGNAAMLGLRPLQALVHAAEEVMRGPVGPAWVPVLGAAAAAMRRAVDRTGTPDQAAALASLAAPLAALEVGPSATPPSPAATKGVAGDGDASGGAPASGETAAADGDAGLAPRADDLREGSVRVPMTRLEPLLSQVDDLVRVAAALRAWAEGRRAALRADGSWREVADLVEGVETAAHAVRRSATSLRLVPVERVFSRFPALAADLARAQGKRLRVVLEGEGTELDKSTADALLDPLLHLVRNAVDHGVEPPEARAAAGKDPVATLRLAAVQEGDRVRIEVEDDGRGLDRDAVLRRARELGLPVDGDGEMEPEAVADLVFRPGFSTRREADAVSGRGVGLDVVRAAMDALRGRVEAEDGDAGGTRFVLTVPLTVALVPVLYFRAAGETLAIPALDVEETARAPAPGFVGPAETVTVRGEAMPLVRLDRVFGWDGGAEPRFVLVLRRGGRAAAVGADGLLAQDAAPVRALPGALGRPRGVSGAVVDAHGRVVLLVDPAQLLELNVDLYRGGGGGG